MRHGILEQITFDRSLLARVIQEVLRYDPPVQNTRRFVARSGTVAGVTMKEGDAILVVLAAANRDPACNPNAAQFDLFRGASQLFTFGAGRHACPGQTLAATIAEAAIDQLLEARTGSSAFPPNLEVSSFHQCPYS